MIQLLILLETQSNPTQIIGSLIGLAIAIIWLMTRQSKKDKEELQKKEDEKNKMK